MAGRARGEGRGFAALHDTLTLRMIRLKVAAKGCRTRTVVLVSTLLDAQAYPADALRELYGQRWQVELHPFGFAQGRLFTKSRPCAAWTSCAAKAPA